MNETTSQEALELEKLRNRVNILSRTVSRLRRNERRLKSDIRMLKEQLKPKTEKKQRYYNVQKGKKRG